jgi:hypothetical protein
MCVAERGRHHATRRHTGQTHATNNGSLFCTHYVAIYCCSGSLSSSLARSLHLPPRHADLVGVAALLTLRTQPSGGAVPHRGLPRTREEKDEGVPRAHRVWCPPL